jgi:hypothetical protein
MLRYLLEEKGVRHVLPTYQVHRDGPYLRIVIPHILPPDWEALRKEVVEELQDDAVDRISIVTPRYSYDRPDREALEQLVRDLALQDAQTHIEWS